MCNTLSLSFLGPLPLFTPGAEEIAFLYLEKKKTEREERVHMLKRAPSSSPGGAKQVHPQLKCLLVP